MQLLQKAQEQINTALSTNEGGITHRFRLPGFEAFAILLPDR